MRQLSNSNQYEIVDRKQFILIQTPQIFQSQQLYSSFQTGFDNSFTDDASVVEKNFPLHFIEGEERNIKITYEDDVIIASNFLI
jgi:2-C-methyl-D-erythritol 4-phosphate cytidylyltransferase